MSCSQTDTDYNGINMYFSDVFRIYLCTSGLVFYIRQKFNELQKLRQPVFGNYTIIPLNLWAFAQKKSLKFKDFKDFWEGAQSDSNRRHSEPQSDALTN